MGFSCGLTNELLDACIAAQIAMLVREAETQALERLFRLRPPVNVWLLDEVRA